MQNKFWHDSAQKLTSLALSSNTWHKYFAAYNKLNCYLKDTNQTLTWPLEQRVINGFILWCKERDSLRPQSVKAYIFGLSKIQKFLGFSKIQFSKTYTEDLLKGWEHEFLRKTNKKGRMTFQKLKEIRKHAKKQMPRSEFLTVWAACSLAFFTSCRMGELISSLKTEIGPLTWGDIKLKKNKAKLKIKWSKTSNAPEYMYIFRTGNKKICPVSALQQLKFFQIKHNTFNDNESVFKLNNSTYLTKSYLNKWF
jgi:integrase